MQGVLEIHHVGGEEEPAFALRQRRVVLRRAPELGDTSYVREIICQWLAPAAAVPPPAKWPVPDDSASNLAKALPWYLENYTLQRTLGEVRARFVRQALYDWGKEVYSTLFCTDAALKYYEELFGWSAAVPVIAGIRLSQNNRIEIHSSDPSVLAWPWEALVDQKNWPVGRGLAVDRRFGEETEGYELEEPEQRTEPLRVLLVSSRTGIDDVDYRLVGRPLAAAAVKDKLTVLRPPTLGALSDALASAEPPFDVLHFDCHGAWADTSGRGAECHLLLEADDGHVDAVNADRLLAALSPVSVPHVVLTACRSAMTSDGVESAFPSLATALLSAHDLQDVTAMAYNLPVKAAAPFLIGFYGSLENGDPVATAVENGRFSMEAEVSSSADSDDGPSWSWSTASIKPASDEWLVPVSYRRSNTVRFDEHGSDPPRRTSMAMPEPCLGRDDNIWLLDRLAPDVRVATVCGLIGAGKTHLLREFLWWRGRTGDGRPTIWIDLERMTDGRAVLDQMAAGFADRPGDTASVTELTEFLHRRFVDIAHWIVWDHVDAAAGLGGPSARCGFQDHDRALLHRFLEGLAAGGSVVLIAGRNVYRWLHLPTGYALWAVPGLRAEDRLALARIELATEGVKADEATRLLTDPALERLLFYLAGLPAITKAMVRRIASGSDPAILHQCLRFDWRRIAAESAGPDMVRLEAALSELDHEEVRPLLPLLSLHEEIIDHRLLCAMARTAAPDLDDASIAAALQRLERAGLLHQGHLLHSSVGGYIRGNASLIVRDKDLDAFVDVIVEIWSPSPIDQSRESTPGGVVSPDETPPRLSVGTLLIALDRLVVGGRVKDAIEVSNRISDLYLRRGDLKEAVAVQQRLLRVVGTSHGSDARVATLLSAIKVAIASSDTAGAETWLEEVAAAASTDAAPAPSGRILYLRAKLAELRGDVKSYRSLLREALAKPDAAEDDALARSIMGQLGAVAARSGEPDEDDGETGYPAGSAQDLRARAQHLIPSGDLAQARRLLDRAIAIDTRDGRLIEKAMNVSLRAVVLSRIGDVDSARASFDEAVAIFEQVGDRRSAAISHHQWGKAAYDHGLAEEAGYQFIQSARTFAEIGDTATLELVAGNFERFLESLTPGLKGWFSAHWTSAGLPATDKMRELLVQTKEGGE